MIARKVLRLLGSRYGIALILLLVVVAAVALAQSGDDREDGTTEDPGRPDTTVDPSGPDDGFAPPSGAEEEPDPDPLPQAAVDAASSFADAWAGGAGLTRRQWLDGMAPYASPELMTELELTAPENVPATEITGEPEVSATAVEFETDAGTLALRMIERDGVWLADGVDFTRART